VSQKEAAGGTRYKFANIVYKIDLHTRSKDNHFSPKNFFFLIETFSFSIKFK
jgi:hypothetical protein